MSNKSPSKIVSRPRLWPASFTKPEVSQNVCIKTYIFKNGTDIQKFVKFLEDSFPKYDIDIKQNKDGSTSVSLTNTNTSASNDTLGIPVEGGVSNFTGTCTLSNCNQKKYNYKKQFDDWGGEYVIWKICDSKFTYCELTLRSRSRL